MISYPHINPVLKLVILGLSLSPFINACAGGGGGGTPPITPPTLTPPAPAFNAPPLPTISPSDPANTPEFRINHGLQQINAHAAYARGVSGTGVTVAFIDDGIDIDHPDLDDNISPLGLDIRTGQFADLDTQQTHGTQIAGIIAAERNNIGGHGVAYGADLLAIRAFDTTGTVSDIVAGIDYARTNGANILNLSLTIDTLPFELRQALDRAVNDGMLIVFSAGNNLSNNPNRANLDPISTYATLSSSNGQAIAVGAVDDQNNLFFLSNRPGTAGANVYLLAPGVDIISTTVGGGLYQLSPSTTPNAFGVDLNASGTSFAAPHVAGAAAVLWEMFPNLSAQEVVELLLTTAVDVGVAGVDPITGHGIIDLGAATQPQGATSIALGKSSFSTHALTNETHLITGTAYGDAVARTNAFDGAFVQDSYRRAYQADFRQFTSTATTNLDIQSILNTQHQTRSAAVRVSPSTLIHLSAYVDDSTRYISDMENTAWSNQFGGTDLLGINNFTVREVHNVALSSQTKLPDGSIITLSNGFTPPDFVAGSIGVTPGALNNSHSLNAYGNLLRGGTNLTWRRQAFGTATFNFSASTNERRTSLSGNTVRDSQYEIGLSKLFGEQIRLSGALGHLSEEGSALGLTGIGAFDGINSASTHYLKVGATSDTIRWSPFATIELGATDVNIEGPSLLSAFSTMWTSSFSVGFHSKSLLSPRDKFSLSISQPLRVESGATHLSLATQIDEYDQLTRSARTIALTPSARETDLHASYSLPIGPLFLSGEYLYRGNPGHTVNNSAESYLLLSVSNKF